MTNTAKPENQIRVLLIDDQPMIGEAVRRMLSEYDDIEFRYCNDPTLAIPAAEEFEPTVILQDLVMPDIDGLTLVKFMRANSSTKEVPLIVLSSKEEADIKAEAFALGANDYLVKLPDKIEVVARIRYHSNAYINHLERIAAYQALEESQKRLASELNEAAGYVESLLPSKLEGKIYTDWKFIPSMELGGDSFGYHWLDDDHFAIYLLDVSGHGVGAALLSVSVINALRSHTLPNVNFHDPSSVLQALNHSFQMSKQNNMFFTIWYGVYNKNDRKLLFASGGHPSALLVRCNQGKPDVQTLQATGLLMGVKMDYHYQASSTEILPGDKLYVYSDGVFEIRMENGKMWEFNEFLKVIGDCAAPVGSDIERIYNAVESINTGNHFEDDYSMLQVIFT